VYTVCARMHVDLKRTGMAVNYKYIVAHIRAADLFTNDRRPISYVYRRLLVYCSGLIVCTCIGIKRVRNVDRPGEL